MGQATIDFEGQHKLKLTAPYPVLKKCLEHVTGLNLSKSKTHITTAKDEMSCYYLMKHSNVEISPQVRSWLLSCKIQRENLADLFSNPQPVKAKYLYPFQTSDVSFMVEAERCINANDPGIGKTIEGIAACDQANANKILVVAPKSLMYMWADEFRERSFGDIVVCDEKSSYKRNEKILAKMGTDARIYIINYAMLDSKKWPLLFKQHWDVVMCDEAHALKNPDATRTKEASKLKTKNLWLLTGTPDPNGDVIEIWGLLNLLEPKRFTSKWAFAERYAYVDEIQVTKDIVNKQVGQLKPGSLETFHRLLMTYMFRRKKEEVYKDLPERIYRTIPLELSSYERKLYDQLYKEMIAQLDEDHWVVTKSVLERNIRLRQSLLSPALIGGKDESTKTQALLDLIENTPGQIIVFSWFKMYTKYLGELFSKQGIKHLIIDGNVKDAQEVRRREKLFQSDPSYKVIAGTIGKMGEGLNLQNASALIFTDKSYVPKDNNQAEARIHRPGLKQRPLIITLQAKNTLEEQIAKTLEAKQNSIDEIESFQYLVDQLRVAY